MAKRNNKEEGERRIRQWKKRWAMDRDQVNA